jgi:hypothetical protein
LNLIEWKVINSFSLFLSFRCVDKNDREIYSLSLTLYGVCLSVCLSVIVWVNVLTPGDSYNTCSLSSLLFPPTFLPFFALIFNFFWSRLCNNERSEKRGWNKWMLSTMQGHRFEQASQPLGQHPERILRSNIFGKRPKQENVLHVPPICIVILRMQKSLNKVHILIF